MSASRGAAPDPDPLFAPTLQDAPEVLTRPSRRPWRLESQFAVAFFGGGGALTTIAFLNARRLGMSTGACAAVLAIGLVGWALALAVGLAGLRVLPYQIAAIATWAILRQRQREPDRRYHYFGEGEAGYDSLVVPGLAAVVGFRALEAAVLWGLTSALA
ncbi:MAG: hypothetical protein WKF31_02655 [Thermoleophilaceae bacterium]